MLHGRQADIADGAQGVEHLAVLHLEVRARGVDVGGADLHVEALGVLIEDGQLVGVGDVEAHRGGDELHRRVRLEPGGLVGDDGVGRRVALVEAVAGELVDQLEDRGGLGLRHAASRRPFDEHGLLLGHLVLLLLAHGAAQQVRAAERVAGQDLGDLHHLFLVDDDAVGLLEHRLQGRVQIVDLAAAELAVDEGRDVVHRARTVEGADGGDVLDGIGPQLAQGVAHALAFHLEDPDRVAVGHQFVGLGVVQRQGREIHPGPALLEEAQRLVDHRQGLQAQEVELHEARAFDPLHVELRRRQVRPRVLIQGRQFGQRPVADHHAGGMGGGVAVEPLQLQGHVQQAGDGLVLVASGAQARLDLDGLGQPVHLAERQLQHPADVAQHSPRLQRAEGDDLGHAVAAIALLDVGDHLLSPVLAEVDVEVGHRDPLRVEEALEEQAVTQRIQIGDGQGIGHQRTGARPPARAHGNAVRLGPLDEVRDDQEVAGEAHLGDDPDLPLQPFEIFRLRRVIGLALGHAGLQTFARLMGQLLGLAAVAFGGEARQDRIALVDHEGAAARDIERVVASLGKIGEKRPHLMGRLEPVLARDPAALVLTDEGAVGDAEQSVVRLVHLRLGEVGVVGRHQRHVMLIGEGDELRLGQGLGLQAVALQLHIEAVAEDPVHFGERRPPLGHLSGGHQRIDRSVPAAGQQDQALGVLGHLRPRHGRLLHAADAVDEGGRGQFGKIEIAPFGLGQEDDGGRPRPLLRQPVADAGHRQGAADDGLDALPLRGHRKLQRAIEVGAVGERDGRHVLGRGQLADGVGLDGAFEQGVGRADAQMDEAACLLFAHPHLRTAAPSAHQVGDLADHPNEARHRSKCQRFPRQTNDHHQLPCGPLVDVR